MGETATRQSALNNTHEQEYYEQLAHDQMLYQASLDQQAGRVNTTALEYLKNQ